MKKQGTKSSATARLREILAANRHGKGVGIYSMCSANRSVLEAGMLQAARDESLLLIESTSNQVNQFGGYTGQTPAEFVKSVRDLAGAMRFPASRIILGGDHLGPHVWRRESSHLAMQKACGLVEAYVKAGFCKIHLDASMPCADDGANQNGTLPDEIVAERAAELCRVSEDSWNSLKPSPARPLYVVGTEVPVPGGELTGSRAPELTGTKDLAQTLQVTRKAFLARGLESAWDRVIAVVVQPGVEFGDATVFPYDSKKARALSRFVSRAWSGVYEAHSTDYQTACKLRDMVLDHFAILKVGPWLTFAFREAVFALAAVEKEYLLNRPDVQLSDLPETLEAAMLKNPAHWKNYYQGTGSDLRIARKYSYSDRARYYWPEPSVGSALERLLQNLNAHPAPLSLLSQYLPGQAAAVKTGALANTPVALIRGKISEVLDHYSYAVGCRRDASAAKSSHLC